MFIAECAAVRLREKPQCPIRPYSYSAVASALDFFYGRQPNFTDGKAFEDRVFVAPVTAAGFGGYYGWGPWTSYMVGSGKMTWNDRAVTDLKAERFSLRTEKLPVAKDSTFVVSYAAGERERLRAKLLAQLARGPVVLWTPYAASLSVGKSGKPWAHVARVDASTDSVLFSTSLTHSVTLFARPGGRILVTDCSASDGVYFTDPDTVVSTSSAMAAFVRLGSPGNTVLDRVRGVKDDEFNVVFFKSPAK